MDPEHKQEVGTHAGEGPPAPSRLQPGPAACEVPSMNTGGGRGGPPGSLHAQVPQGSSPRTASLWVGGNQKSARSQKLRSPCVHPHSGVGGDSRSRGDRTFFFFFKSFDTNRTWIKCYLVYLCSLEVWRGGGRGAKKTPQACAWLYSGGEKVISSNKRVINCGEVKGD